MKVLFVDHVWRQHSHSADFFKEVLKEAGCEVVDFWFDRCYRYEIPKDVLESVDVIVLWEFLFGRFLLGLEGRRCVYVPMYDNESGSKWLWRRIALSGMPVISFCDRVSQMAREGGVKDIVDVRFAFDPAAFVGFAGDPRVVSLWDRGQVGFAAVKALFDPADVDRVIVVRKEEETWNGEAISAEDAAAYHVEIRQGKYLPPKEYVESLKETGIFIAPRYKEGIGLPFLEHLAMGKCVIAHDEPTMNEYVRDGKTGLLTNMRNPRRITREEIEEVRRNVPQAAREAYARWNSGRQALVSFFAAPDRVPRMKSMRGSLSFVMFLISVVEYGFLRLKGQSIR